VSQSKSLVFYKSTDTLIVVSWKSSPLRLSYIKLAQPQDAGRGDGVIVTITELPLLRYERLRSPPKPDL
jgi:hypothetical protein